MDDWVSLDPRSGTRTSSLFSDADAQSDVPSFSTNSTASNLVGTGRVLGNFYSYTGRHLERAIGAAAHKAGFGPDATYERIQQVYQTNWKNDQNKKLLLRELCFKLCEYATKSNVDKTVATAIHKLGDLFRSYYDFFIWMTLIDGEEFKARTNAVYTAVTEATAHYGPTGRILLLHRFGQCLLMVDCARLSTDGGEVKVDWLGDRQLSDGQVEEWHKSLFGVVSSLRYPVLSRLSLWYLCRCLGACQHAQLAQLTHASIQEALNYCDGLTVRALDVDNVDCISLLIEFSIRLDDVGKKKEASTAQEHASRLCSSLIALVPVTGTIDLSHSFRKIASGLCKIKKLEEAADISYMDVKLCRRLAAHNPRKFDGDLERSLEGLCDRIEDVGRWTSALEATEECVDIYRKRTDRDPDKFYHIVQHGRWAE